MQKIKAKVISALYSVHEPYLQRELFQRENEGEKKTVMETSSTPAHLPMVYPENILLFLLYLS